MEREIIDIRKMTIKRAMNVFGLKETFEKIKTQLSLVAINELIKEDKEVKAAMKKLSDYERYYIINHFENFITSA